MIRQRRNTDMVIPIQARGKKGKRYHRQPERCLAKEVRTGKAADELLAFSKEEGIRKL